MKIFQSLVFAALLLSTLSAFSQQSAPTGFPPFGTFQDSEFDTVNVGSLNVHFEIPIVSKAGRGMPFVYKLVYDSSLWVAIQSTNAYGNIIWTWSPKNLGYGWDVGSISGYVTYDTKIQRCDALGDTLTERINYAFHEPNGTAHSFGAAAIERNDCGGHTGGFPPTAALDGTGYMLAVDSSFHPTVTTPSGAVIAAPQTTPSSGYALVNTGTITDSNGNQISGFTDTLGLSAITIGGTPSASTYTYPSPTNPANLVGVTVNSTSYTLQTNFGCANVVSFEYGPQSVSLISSIVMPDGGTYVFGYEGTPGYPGSVTGRISSITLPSGGTISFTYTGGANGATCLPGSGNGVLGFTSGVPPVLTRTTPDGVWTYTRNATTSSPFSTTTIVDPKGNTDVITMYGANQTGYADYELKRQSYQGSSTGTLLRTIETCYNGNAFPCSANASFGVPISRKTVRTEWPDANGSVSQTDTLFNTVSLNTAALVTDVSEYDYGSGGPPTTPIRTTHIDYAALGNNIRDRPSVVTVKDGTGNILSQTTYGYDETAPAPTSGIPNHVAISGSRGNQTSVTQLIQGTTTRARTTSYYDTGTPNVVKDFNGNPTTYGYGSGSCGGAFPTSITNALNQTVSATWDCNGAVKTSQTDANKQPTSFVFGDPNFWRPTATNYPDGGQVATTYNLASPPWSIVRTTKLDTSAPLVNTPLVNTTVYDSLGRARQTQLNSDPQGITYVDTSYDATGRVSTVSNPHRSFSESTFGLTSYGYDALGRTTDVVKADGSVVHTDYTGNVTTVTDEAGHTRRTTVNALGRITEVDEPGASSALGAPGAAARVSGSISGHVQMDPAALSAVLQTINTLLLTGSQSTTTTTTAPASTSTSTSTPNSTAAPNPASPSPAEAITNAPAATTASSPANPNYDTGKVWLSIKGFLATANYQQGSTAGSIARDLASQFNVAGSPVFARVDGDSQLVLLSRIPGAAGNLTIDDQGTKSDNPSKYPNPSFTISMSPSNWINSTPGNLSSPLVTLYQYDAQGNLLRADQKGTAPSDSTQWRTRRFAYDSLSRLLTASNPESGTINYSYDANGNLLQKTSPAPNQTGAATQTISYCYDALDRVTGKAYAAQNCPLNSPAVSLTYDAGANGIGHLTSLTDQAGSASYSYDVMGRIKAESRTIAGASKSMSYLYNLDGSIQSITYPSTATITYTPDAAGRMLSAVDSGHGINYVSGATYSVGGLLTGFASGNSGITNSFSYNQRLQPVTMSAALPTQTLFSLTYDFHFGAGDNGNVFAISNNKDTTRSRSFAYDALNRLTSAQNAGNDCSQLTLQPPQTKYWGNNYGYDAWGNLLSKSPTKCTPESMSVTALANNQLSGYGYDAAGNMTSGHMNSDPTVVITATYDAENRIATAASTKNGTTTTTNYAYDADGNRVEKSNPTSGTLYWYMSPGIVAESDLSGNLQSEYVFFDGQRVARKDSPSGAVSYYFSDHLKTTDVVTDAQGTIKNESDFYPFGGELQFANSDSNHYKFTGKERDSETQLDYFGARYYSNGLGRFITPDPSGLLAQHPENAQSWNLYAYVRNNPLILIDPDGLDCLYVNDGGRELESIDHNSDAGKCGRTGGTWAPGYVDENWVHFNNNTGMFQVGSVDGAGNNATVDYTNFAAGALTDASGNCLAGCNNYGFASANANWLQSQLVGSSQLGGLDGYIQFLTGREEPLHGGLLNQLVSGPLDPSQNHWAGPGGMGPPGGRGDWAASVHDYNFSTNGPITLGSYFNPTLSVPTAKALIQSNKNLIRNAGGIQGVKMGMFFGVVNAFQWYANSWK